MFFDFTPRSAGVLSEETAYLTFTSQSELDRFIQKGVDGLVLPTGELLSVRQVERLPGSSDQTEVEETRERKTKQLLREKRRLERAGEDEMNDLGGLFD